MPMEKHFQYGSEAEFTSHFLVPLLRRLGYSVVVDYHGPHEFGKDLVFGEIDRFGQVAYHGLQAKYVDSISQSDSHDLVKDCREAFDNPFRHPTSGAEERISTFTVANGGSITPGARTNFFNALAVPHGGHIRMLDGKQLVDLDRWASVRQVESVGEQLSGLRLELRYNAMFMPLIKDIVVNYRADEKSPLPLERLRVVATAGYLARPVLATHIDTQTVQSYWHAVSNLVNPGLDVMATGLHSRENRLHVAELVLTHIDTALRLGTGIEEAVNIVLTQLGPIAAI